MSENKLSKKEYFINKIIERLEEADKEIVEQWKNPTHTKTRHFLDNLYKKDVEEIYFSFPTNGGF